MFWAPRGRITHNCGGGRRRAGAAGEGISLKKILVSDGPREKFCKWTARSIRTSLAIDVDVGTGIWLF